MTLTTKQEEGLKIALDRHKNNEKYVVISGYARYIRWIKTILVELSKIIFFTFYI